MRKKILGIFVCMLFLLTSLSSTEASTLNDDDLDVKISASLFGTDIGFGIRVELKNNRDDNLTVYINDSVDRIFLNFLDYNRSHRINLTGNDERTFGIGLGFTLSRFIITVEGGNTKVMREGIQILRLYIFLK